MFPYKGQKQITLGTLMPTQDTGLHFSETSQVHYHIPLEEMEILPQVQLGNKLLTTNMNH